MATIAARAAGHVPAALSSPADRLEITELTEAALPEAAECFAAAYRQMLAAEPLLPGAYAQPAEIVPRLRRILRSGPALAAFRSGRLAGYLAGVPIAGLHGTGPGVFVPEWAHASAMGEPAVLTALYSALASGWVEMGIGVQCVSTLATDTVAHEELAWLGFGRCCVDAIRAVDEPGPPAAPPDVGVVRATSGDFDALAPLALAHDRHYAAAPTFLYRDPAAGPLADLRRRLDAPDEAVLMALGAAGEPAGFLYLAPPGDGTCLIVHDPRTIAISGAFTLPSQRSRGVGSGLLARAVDWARDTGFERISVDFEPANVAARRFWLRAFTPVCLSFERRIDPRVVAGAGR